jgi:hypothetical protein
MKLLSDFSRELKKGLHDRWFWTALLVTAVLGLICGIFFTPTGMPPM